MKVSGGGTGFGGKVTNDSSEFKKGGGTQGRSQMFLAPFERERITRVPVPNSQRKESTKDHPLFPAPMPASLAVKTRGDNGVDLGGGRLGGKNTANSAFESKNAGGGRFSHPAENHLRIGTHRPAQT